MFKKFPKSVLSLLTIALLTILIDTSCKDKIIIADPPEPTTTYEGIYKRIINYSSDSSEQVIDSQFVEWRFVESRFYCKAINTEQLNPFVCDSYGDYELTQSGKILLKNIAAISQPCNDEEFRGGEFSLKLNLCPDKADSLIMEKLTPDDIFISIKLMMVGSNPI